MKWTIAELGRLARIRRGASPRPKGDPRYFGGTIPWLKIGDVPSGSRFVSRTEETVTEAGREKSVFVEPGTLLLSNSASVGRPVVTNIGACIHDGWLAIDQMEDGINQDYLYWFLVQSEHELKRLAPSGTQANLNTGIVNRLRIPLPPPSEQRRIVELLDQADALRRLRAEADAKADRILPALFLKMFGDPATNPKGWPRERLGSFLDGIDGGWSPVCEDRPVIAGEWGVLKLGAVTGNRYRESEHKSLPQKLAPRPELEVHPGDLLFSRKNTLDLVGACAFVTTTTQKLMLSDLIFRLNLKADSHVHPLYLWGLLTNAAKRRSIVALAGGSAGSMPNISMGRLESMLIEKPPNTLQHVFAEAAACHELIRERMRIVARSLDSLFSQLLHRAFSGDLTATWREAHMKELLQEMEQQARYLAKSSEGRT